MEAAQKNAGSAAQPCKVAVEVCFDFDFVLREKIAQMRLDVAVSELLRIELGRVGGQRLPHDLRLIGDERLDLL